MMTSRERWLAALDMAEVDRLPFWPKLDAAYPHAQRAPFRTMDENALHECFGSDNHEWVPGVVRYRRRDTCVETTAQNGTRTTVYTSPRGALQGVECFDPGSCSWHPVRFPVQSPADVAVLRDCVGDCRVELDYESMDRARMRIDEIGSSAVTACGIGTSALMQWLQHWAGIENGHYWLIEHEDAVLGLFEAMHRVLLRATEIACERAPCDVLYLVENTSTTLTSPEQYRTYCYPQIREYTRIASEAGRMVILHMCGHLKLILPELSKLPVTAFEAFTSPPVGNTLLSDGRAACPRTCLIGGTNAALWTLPVERIIAELESHLDALPHHRGIVVSSAGVMPPLASP